MDSTITDATVIDGNDRGRSAMNRTRLPKERLHRRISPSDR